MSRIRKYSDEDFINAIKNSISIREALIKLGLKGSGGNYSLAKRRIKNLNIDTSHFLGNGYLKGQHHNWANKRSLKDILIQNSPVGGSSKVKKRLFQDGLFERRCYQCGIDSWLGKPLSLELEHINGDSFDNRIENLTILCPNCHSLTPTYRRRKSSFIEKKKCFCNKCGKEISKYSKSGFCVRCARIERS